MRSYLHIGFALSGLLLGGIACQAVAPEVRPMALDSGTPARNAATPARNAATPSRNEATPAPAPARSDETLFRTALRQLQTAVTHGDSASIRGLLHFPLLTAPQWTNDDIHDHTADTAGGVIRAAEFQKVYGAIFHRDVRRLLPKADESSLNEITADTKENYYRRLARQTDPGSHLYEVYMQYPDGFFGFVFGRINRQYKVISYYAKWPVTN